MFFESVTELIKYLEKFNPNAKILTDMGFSWSKTGQKNEEDSRKTTNILYVYGEYYPTYMDKEEYFDLKDYINYEIDTKYDITSVDLKFDEDTVQVIVKYYPELTFSQRQKNHYNLILDVLEYCKVNDCESLMDDIILLYVPASVI